MRNRLWTPLLLALFAAGPVSADPPALDLDLDADDGPAAVDVGLEMPKEREPTPRGVGYHEKVEAFHDKEVTYKLYVPQQYAETEDALPLLVVQNPGGRPNIKRYQPWADEHGVILVGINKVSNGMPQHNKGRYWNGVLKDFQTIGLRVHPQLKFTVGMSGGSADGERMTRGKGEQFSGLVLQGAGVIPKREDREHFAVAVLFGALDPLVNIPSTYEKVDDARERGMQVMLRVYPKLEHDWAPLEGQFEALTWLLHTARLTHPGLSDEERAAWRAHYEKKLAMLNVIDEPGERLNETRTMMEVEPIWSLEAASHLPVSYLDAAIQAAAEQPSTAAALAIVADAKDVVSSFDVTLPKLVARSLQQALQRYASDPAAVSSLEHRQRFGALQERERHAGRDQQLLTDLVADYAALERASEGTIWSDRAKAERVGLEKWLKKHGGS